MKTFTSRKPKTQSVHEIYTENLNKFNHGQLKLSKKIGKTVKPKSGKKKLKKSIKKAELAPASSINVSDNEEVN